MIRVLVLCYLWVFTLLVSHFEGRVEQLARLPDELQTDFDIYQQMTNLRTSTARLIFWQILENYVSKFVEKKVPEPWTPRQKDYFQKSVAGFMHPIVNYNPNSTRVKRQSDLRIRREIRMLSIDQRRRYFTAVNEMKRDRRLPPNVYDVLAGFHSGQENIRRAHFGPNFMSWHRLYLYLYESFLRTYDPEVTIPYWASLLDDALGNRSTDSVIWSNGFFGGGEGVISSGPFRNWRFLNPDTVFERDIGGSPLYTQGDIDAILRKTRNAQLFIPTADGDSNAEMMHGKAHVYVSGTMNRLNNAPNDPLFYSHHCFVDFIWEQFRFKQLFDGIVDPQEDNPYIIGGAFRSEHAPNETMGFFPNGEIAIDFFNALGYSNAFFGIVSYEPLPTCENACGGSAYLTCENVQCRSYTISEMGSGNYIDDLFNETSPSTNTSLPQQKESGCPEKPVLKERDSIKIPASSSIQWAYIPVRIISKRSPSLPKFKDYSLYNYGASRARTRLSESKLTLIQAGTQKGFGTCEKFESAVGKVKIITYGLNKRSLVEETAIVDNRLGISHSTGFAVVRAPSPGNPSDAMVAAFDTCGRVCRPFCMKTTGSTGFAKFTGGIRVTSELPLQYGESYADATIASWDIPAGSESPEMDAGNIPLTFYCDYTDEWIWVGPDGPTSYPSIRSQSSRSGSNLGVNLQNSQNVRNLTAGNSGFGIDWLNLPNKDQLIEDLLKQRGIHRGVRRGKKKGAQRGGQRGNQRGRQQGKQRGAQRGKEQGVQQDQFTALNQYKGRRRPVMRWPTPGTRRRDRNRQAQHRARQGMYERHQ